MMFSRFRLLVVCGVLVLTGACAAARPGSDESASASAPLPGNLPPVFVSDTDPGAMVLVPGGAFLMGSDTGSSDEHPPHTVFLDPFYIDSAEVSCERYARFLRETGYTPHDLWNTEYDRPLDPVVGVSWPDAAAFSRWAGKRLPTEAEWEKAARGGLVGKRYPWGDAPDRDRANFFSFGTTPVKSYPPNRYGVYDMAGNVWEWCADWYDAEYYRNSPKENPRGPVVGTKKVIRGGCWFCNEAIVAVANRNRHDPSHRSFNIGFRCAVSADAVAGAQERAAGTAVPVAKGRDRQ